LAIEKGKMMQSISEKEEGQEVIGDVIDTEIRQEQNRDKCIEQSN
jgi:hypothetical protein